MQVIKSNEPSAMGKRSPRDTGRWLIVRCIYRHEPHVNVLVNNGYNVVQCIAHIFAVMLV